MQSPDHPGLPFLEALKSSGLPMYTKGRPDGPPLWIVVHDMEYPERNTAAEWTAQYFHTGAGGRNNVSSHYCADGDVGGVGASIVQCVLLRDSAWTVGNRLGNNRGINWEFAGFAAQTRADWLDDYSLSMFRTAAPIIQADAAKYGIPLQRRSVDELRALRPGVTSHNDLRLAFGGTTHTDPGPSFPWDVFMQIITGNEKQKEQGMDLVRFGITIYHHMPDRNPATGKMVLRKIEEKEWTNALYPAGYTFKQSTQSTPDWTVWDNDAELPAGWWAVGQKGDPGDPGAPGAGIEPGSQLAVTVTAVQPPTE